MSTYMTRRRRAPGGFACAGLLSLMPLAWSAGAPTAAAGQTGTEPASEIVANVGYQSIWATTHLATVGLHFRDSDPSFTSVRLFRGSSRISVCGPPGVTCDDRVSMTGVLFGQGRTFGPARGVQGYFGVQAGVHTSKASFGRQSGLMAGASGGLRIPLVGRVGIYGDVSGLLATGTDGLPLLTAGFGLSVLLTP